MNETWFDKNVPEGWEVTRLKNVVNYVKNGIWGEDPNGDEADIECVRIADFDRQKNVIKNRSLTLRNIDKAQVARYLLKQGDLLIEKSGGGDKQPVGFVVQYNLDKKAVYANFMARIDLKLDKVDSSFMNFVFSALYYVKANLKAFNQTTGIQNLNSTVYLNEIFTYPKLEVQVKIKNYLELKTNEIDNLIKAKETLIKMLQQQRQSIITEAVTKGLNPNGKMKVSGVEWIGEIPIKWEIKRLKDVLYLNPSKNEVSHKKNIDVTFLPMENIKAPNDVDYSIKKSVQDVYNGYTYFKEEDLVLAKVTPCFENGNLSVMRGLTNGLGFGTTELHVLRTKPNQNIDFYYYVVQSSHFKQQAVSTMYGVGGLKRIPNEFILNFKLGIPPEEEQSMIVDFLNTKVSEITSIKKLISIQIEKLKEYRQSLIYEAVTGKIDVSEIELEEVR